MKISYDYEEFLQEFKEELEDGALTVNDKIQILRGPALSSGYRPIIDWYYMPGTQERDAAIDPDDDAETIKDKNMGMEYYKEDWDDLESVTLKEVLEEMEEWNRTI